MQRRAAMAVAAGGAAGASVRWAVVEAWLSSSILWGLLAVNAAGSLALGAAMAARRRRPTARTLLHDGVGIGFCGGLTTFSTFAVEVAHLARDDRWVVAVAFVGASLASSIFAVMAGAWLLQRRRALDAPLEGAP